MKKPCVLLGMVEILTSESVNEILFCDHSKETSLAVFFCMVSYLFFNILQNEIWDFFGGRGRI